MTDKTINVKKRDGRTVTFDKEKITNAIFRAAQSVGGTDKRIAEKLSGMVIELLAKKYQKDNPTVENVQDAVEKVLIEDGHARTVKSYILYREKRAEVRNEKMIVLEKNETDEVDKNFDVNALRVLKARYLRKEESGKLIETPKELFTRVTTHLGIATLFYDASVFDIDGNSKVFESVSFDPVKNENKYAIGKYRLNKYHLEALKRIYDRFNKNKQMRVSWSQFLEKIEKGDLNKYEDEITEFYDLMVSRKFMPNTPAIANFGNPLGMGSACFVMDVKDSIEDIMETLKQTSIVFKAGGGMGYNFSKLRPEGDFVSTTGGVASGPLSFMRLFDTMTEVIKQGGIRRGANMGIMNSNHPDIEKFITAKSGNKSLTNFNISVLLMPDFWEHYEKNKPYPLINPRTNKVVKTISARALFDKIVYQAWESAEPGVIFFDRVNEYNPFFEHLGPIVTTNPCGEVLLYPYESCNLGSINLWKFVKKEDGKITYDWEGLKDTVRTAARILDNVIDMNKFPLKEIEDMALATRKTGLGIMGLGDTLYELKIPFNSPQGLDFMEKMMEFVNYYSKVEAIDLARKRGNLPYYDKSFYPEGKLPFAGYDDKKSWRLDWKKISDDIKKYGVRNGYTIVIAPTGSISMIAGCSSGMEPVYSLTFEKNVKVGSFYYTNHVFEEALKNEGLYTEELMEHIVNNKGSVQNLPMISEKMKKVFVTAMDITPEDHIRALAAIQKWTDSSISKTNNFPADATVEDMKKSYIFAYKLGCKDVTVYRDSSIKEQVLVAGQQKKSKKKEEVIRVEVTSSKQSSKLSLCPECNIDLEQKEGCMSCPECGWGLCT